MAPTSGVGRGVSGGDGVGACRPLGIGAAGAGAGAGVGVGAGGGADERRRMGDGGSDGVDSQSASPRLRAESSASFCMSSACRCTALISRAESRSSTLDELFIGSSEPSVGASIAPKGPVAAALAPPWRCLLYTSPSPRDS